MLTQTILNGVYCIRLAVGAARTNETHIKKACELLDREAKLAIAAYGEQAIIEEST